MSVECFVTGGSGFVGQHLLAALTAQGHKTWVLMRSPGNIERLKEQVGQLGGNPEYLHAVEGDISQEGLGLSEADKGDDRENGKNRTLSVRPVRLRP